MTELADIELIKRLKYKYLRCLDCKKWEALAVCFSEDAVTSYASGAYRFKGRENIISFLKEALPKTLITMHQGLQPEIELSEDGAAKGTWAFQDYLIDTNSNISLRGYGFYDDEYIKVDGEWQIQSTGYTRVFEESWNRADTPSATVTENMFAPRVNNS